MNKAFLVGRLGKDPVRLGDKVVVFTVATSAGKDKEPVWHNVKTFDKLADICEKILTKGRQVAVAGEINNFRYKNKEGKDVYGSEVVAQGVEFLGERQDGRPQGTTDVDGLETLRLSDVAPSGDHIPW